MGLDTSRKPRSGQDFIDGLFIDAPGAAAGLFVVQRAVRGRRHASTGLSHHAGLTQLKSQAGTIIDTDA